MMQPHQHDTPVSVFWDVENCAVPSNMRAVQVVNAVRSFALQRGILKNISAVANLKLIKEDLKADLQESGVLLHDVARKSPNSSDMVILNEILKAVLDCRPPHCIILISGDRDFANFLSTLTFRRYHVCLIHSLQASEVLKNAASEGFEWGQLLKRGGDMTGNVAPSLHAPYDKFQPLIDFLVQRGKPKVQFSELGSLVPYQRLGYMRLKDYVFDAQAAGVVRIGSEKNIYWVTLPPSGPNLPLPSNMNGNNNSGSSNPVAGVNGTGAGGANNAVNSGVSSSNSTNALPNGTPVSNINTAPNPAGALNGPLPNGGSVNSGTGGGGVVVANGIPNAAMSVPPINGILPPSVTSPVRTPAGDPRQVVRHLISALESLRKDYFKPTEGTLQRRIKQANMPIQKMDWEEVLSIARSKHLIVEGEKPNRVIYPPSGPFDGVDPSHPDPDHFPQSIWKTLRDFFHRAHPVERNGRYWFAMFLKEEGPPEIQEMPLGSVTELVQLSLQRQLLKYYKGQVSTFPPEMEGMLGGGGDGGIGGADGAHTHDGAFIPYGHSNLPPGYYANGVPPDGAENSAEGTDYLDFDHEESDEPMTRDDKQEVVLVGTHFVWPYPAISSVLMTGSFFSWRNTIALNQRDYSAPSSSSPHNSPKHLRNSNHQVTRDNSGSSGGGVSGAMTEHEEGFSTLLYLPPGTYEYKFIVDGAWCYDPCKPFVANDLGGFNNVIVVEPSAVVNNEPLLVRDYAN